MTEVEKFYCDNMKYLNVLHERLPEECGRFISDAYGINKNENVHFVVYSNIAFSYSWQRCTYISRKDSDQLITEYIKTLSQLDKVLLGLD